MGGDTTTESQLNHVGKALFGKKFGGVFASNEKPRGRYAIVNTKSRGTGGEHWLALTPGLVYDSFGRQKYGDNSGDAEQAMKETNCGQRCLAFLLVYDELGSDFAALI
jgi:hypothetical protein